MRATEDADAVGSGARRVLANTAYRAAADIGSKVISIAFFIVLARKLGESGFGVFVLGLTLAAVLTVLADFGQDLVLTREVARDHRRIDEYFTNTVAVKIAVAVPLILVAAVVTAVLGTDSETRAVLLLLSVALIAERLASTCFAVYQAYEQLAYVPVVIITQRALTAAFGISALVAGADVVAVAAIYLACAVVALGLAQVLLRRVVRPRFLLRPRSWTPLFWAAAPVGIASVFSLLLFRIDTAILALFDSTAVVGAYGAAFRLFEATLFLSWAVRTAVYPVLARLSATSRPTIGDVFDRAVKLVLALTLPLSIGAAILAEPIIDLVYGEEYDNAVRPLVVLAPAIVLYSVAEVCGGLLVARDRQRATAVANGAVAVLNLALSLVLISRFSLDGAAAAALVTQLVLMVGLLAIAHGVTGGDAWRRILSGPAAAGLVFALAVFALRDHLFAAVLVGGLVYVAALAAFERVAYPDDARAIWAFLRGRGRSAAVLS